MTPRTRAAVWTSWHDLEQAADRSSWSLYGAEAIGTALLLIGGLSAVIVLMSPDSPVAAWGLPGWLRRACAGGLFGLTGTAVTLSPFGRHSGAHINPAMTMAFLIEGRISRSHAVGYVLAQCAGAIAGAYAVLAWGHYGAPLEFGATVPATGLPLPIAVALEAAATCIMVTVVFTFLGRPSLKHLTPWTMGPMYAVMVSIEAPYTGTSTNPARTLGPAIAADVWTHIWIYVVGPAIGAAAAVLLTRLAARGERRVEHARLVRHPAAPEGNAPIRGHGDR